MVNAENWLVLHSGHDADDRQLIFASSNVLRQMSTTRYRIYYCTFKVVLHSSEGLDIYAADTFNN